MACYDSKNPNCGCCPPPPPMPTCCFQGPPGVTGAVGATGATGANGADGTAATVQVGTTTTGAPGTNASVTNTGTESNAVLTSSFLPEQRGQMVQMVRLPLFKSARPLQVHREQMRALPTPERKATLY